MGTKITPEMSEAAAYMQLRWKYKSDGKIDKWTINTTTGDCEDFALTVLYRILGKSKTAVVKALLRGEAQIIRTESRPGVGHAVLYYNDMYIDNRYPHWSPRFRYDKRDVYSKAMLTLKLTFGGVVS